MWWGKPALLLTCPQCALHPFGLSFPTWKDKIISCAQLQNQANFSQSGRVLLAANPQDHLCVHRSQ